MIAQNQIDEAKVSVWLNKAADQDKDLSNGGQFIFGGIDNSLFKGTSYLLPTRGRQLVSRTQTHLSSRCFLQ